MSTDTIHKPKATVFVLTASPYEDFDRPSNLLREAVLIPGSVHATQEGAAAEALDQINGYRKEKNQETWTTTHLPWAQRRTIQPSWEYHDPFEDVVYRITEVKVK